VTSVNVEPGIFQIGRDEGFNFSELLEQAIIDRCDPEREIAYLKGQVLYYEKKIEELNDQIKAAEKAENKIKRYMMEEVVERYMEEYQLWGFLPDDVEEKLCDRLKVSVDELHEVFNEKM
jgi:UDP-galactopyranose mutase